jgi:hypothetical protein
MTTITLSEWFCRVIIGKEALPVFLMDILIVVCVSLVAQVAEQQLLIQPMTPTLVGMTQFPTLVLTEIWTLSMP